LPNFCIYLKKLMQNLLKLWLSLKYCYVEIVKQYILQQLLNNLCSELIKVQSIDSFLRMFMLFLY